MALGCLKCPLAKICCTHAGWRVTVQQLLDRLKRCFVLADGDRDVTWPCFKVADSDATNCDNRQRAEPHNLDMATQDASQNPAKLEKLRQHFQKVLLSCLSICCALIPQSDRLCMA